MSRRLLAVAAACAATAALAAAGCSSTQTKLAVAEGTPVTLGNTEYSVQISRYLNPSDPEDEAYLQGAPPLGGRDNYLGVFLQIQNKGQQRVSLPTRYDVSDTADDVFTPAPLDNDFS